MRQGLDWLRRAREAEAEENMTRALRAAETAVREDSWNTAALSAAGRLAGAAGDLARAAEYLGRAAALGARDEETLRELAAVYRKLGRASEALRLLSAAPARSGVAAGPLRLELARLYAATGEKEAARAEYAALAASYDGDAVRAEYAAVLRSLGDARAADEQFREALRRNPNNGAALLHAAEQAVGRGDFDESGRLARQAHAASAGDPDVAIEVGRIHEGRRDWRAAAESYRAVLDLAPERRDARLRLAEALAAAGETAEALEVLRRALEADSGDVSGWRKLAELELRNGQLAEAAGTLESAAASTGQHLLYLRAAELRERRGEYGQALLDYRAMLRSAPKDAGEELRSRLGSHLRAISLMVAGERDFSGLPIERELDLEKITRTKLSATAGPDRTPALPRLVVPGGTDLLARTLRIDAAVLREPDALERLFSFILEGEPRQREGGENASRRDALEAVRDYEALLVHMARRGLLPAGFDRRRGHEFVFPFIGDSGALGKTRDLACGLVPTLLASARVVERARRSDRAQEYVALSTRLARELLAVAAFDEGVRRWCERFLAGRLPARRREQALRSVAYGSPTPAADVLSASELLIMGQEYCRAAAATDSPSTGARPDTPRLESPTLERLASLIPPAGTPDARDFQREVEQYGILLRRRLGLSQVSMAIAESYEQLESSIREEVLYERICDLKIRIAELNYALGLPAIVGEIQSELAVRDILPRSSTVQVDSWRLALEQIENLALDHARSWIDTLLDRGLLVLPQDTVSNRGGTAP